MRSIENGASMWHDVRVLAVAAFLAALALGCGSGDSACEGDAPDDGCNTCQCVCEGGACSWECTLMACLDVTPEVAPDVVDAEATDEAVPLRGDLRVVLKNGTLDPFTGSVGVAFTDIRVTLLPGGPSGFSCDDLSPTVAVNPAEMLGQQTVADTSHEVLFEHLPIASVYTVLATARGPHGNLAGAGCFDDAIVPPGQVGHRNLFLNALTLTPTGSYDALSRLDFTDAVPADARLAGPVAAFAADPVGRVVPSLMTRIEDHLVATSGAVDPALLAALHDELTQAATGWLAQHPADWMTCYAQQADALTGMMAAVELSGTVKLYQVVGGTVNGAEQWEHLDVPWPAGCAAVDACGASGLPAFAATCATNAEGMCRCAVPMADVSDFPGDFVAGSINAFVANQDRMILARHQVGISLGKLLDHVLRHRFTARATAGAFDDLAAALTAVVDCDAMAGGLSAGLQAQAAQANLDLPTLHALCAQAVAQALQPVTASLDGLSTDDSLWWNGGARLVDDDDDLVVDRLVEGYWIGAMQIQGLAGSPFAGTWTATRVP